jgi:hypothetical protein
MKLAEDGDVVSLVDRLSVLQLWFQGSHALVEHSRTFGGDVSVSRSDYKCRERLLNA